MFPNGRSALCCSDPRGLRNPRHRGRSSHSQRRTRRRNDLRCGTLVGSCRRNRRCSCSCRGTWRCNCFGKSRRMSRAFVSIPDCSYRCCTAKSNRCRCRRRSTGPRHIPGPCGCGNRLPRTRLATLQGERNASNRWPSEIGRLRAVSMRNTRADYSLRRVTLPVCQRFWNSPRGTN
jgi:hypothetical protein